MRQIWLQATGYVNAPDWMERKSWHDAIWLLVPILAILVSAPLWFFRLVDVDMGPLTWSLFGYCALREAGNYFLKFAKDTQTTLVGTLFSDFAGVCLLGILWHFAQTIKDPLFLLVMVIPLIAGALIYPSTIIYLFTGVSLVTVMTIAWTDIPQFRDALLQSSLIPAWIAAKISLSGLTLPGLSSSELSAANAAAVLVAFCFSLIIIACIIDGVRRFALSTLQSKSTELSIVSAERRPTFSVDRKTFAITSANNAFREYSLSDATRRAPLTIGDTKAAAESMATSGNLFERIHFEEESDLRQIIQGAGGALLCHYRIGPESRVGRVRVDVLPDGSQCQLALEDLSVENYLRLTLDVLEQAIILLAESEVVLYFNDAAGRLFPALVNGGDASAALQVDMLGSPWWQLGNSARIDRNVRLQGRMYHTVCTASRLPGQQVNISVLSVSEV